MRRLAHIPVGWRPTVLQLTPRRSRRPGRAHVWRQDTAAVVGPRSKLGRLAVLWALKSVGIEVCGHRPALDQPGRSLARGVVARRQRRGPRRGTGTADRRPHQAGRGPGPGGRRPLLAPHPPRWPLRHGDHRPHPAKSSTTGWRIQRSRCSSRMAQEQRDVPPPASAIFRLRDRTAGLGAGLPGRRPPARRPSPREDTPPGPARPRGPACPRRRSGPLSVSAPAWAVAMFAPSGCRSLCLWFVSRRLPRRPALGRRPW